MFTKKKYYEFMKSNTDLAEFNTLYNTIGVDWKSHLMTSLGK